MISSISNSSIDYASLSSQLSSSSQSSLSYDQQQIIDDTLSNYDSSSLTTSDAQEIVSAFQEAGINPSKELEDAMSSLGFDAQVVGELAGLGQNAGIQGGNGMPPPPPPPSSSEEEEDTVSTLLETLFSTDDEDDTSSSAFDTISDYTSRILNLNEDSKQTVMDLFDKYSEENSDLSKEDMATLIQSSLKELLADSNNYNHSTLYA